MNDYDVTVIGRECSYWARIASKTLLCPGKTRNIAHRTAPPVAYRSCGLPVPEARS
jgi:hypothetical protein